MAEPVLTPQIRFPQGPVEMMCPTCGRLQPVAGGLFNVKVVEGRLQDIWVGGAHLSLTCGHTFELAAFEGAD